MPTILQIIQPLVDELGFTAFLVVIGIALLLITQVTHNIVLGAVFFPFICSIADAMGESTVIAWFVMYFALNCWCYMTPAASMNAALIFGNAYAGRKYSYILGTVFTIAGGIVLLLLIPMFYSLL